MPVKCVKQGTHFERSQFTVQNLGRAQQSEVCVRAVPPSLTASQRRGWWHRSYRLGHSEGEQGPSAAQDGPRTPPEHPEYQLHGPPSCPPRAARLPGRMAAPPGEWPKTRPSIGSPWLRVLLRVQRLPCFSSSLTDGQQLSGKCLKKISIMKDSNRNWNKGSLRNRLILGLEESSGGKRNSLWRDTVNT